MRTNPALEREAAAAMMELNELPDEWVARMQEAREVALEEMGTSILQGAVQLSETFQKALIEIEPRIDFFTGDEQERITGFFLLLPRALQLVERGRVAEARTLREQSYRTMARALDERVRELLESAEVRAMVSKLWDAGIIWYAEQFDVGVDEVIGLMLEHAPELQAWMTQHEISIDELRTEILTRAIAAMPRSYFGQGDQLPVITRLPL